MRAPATVEMGRRWSPQTLLWLVLFLEEAFGVPGHPVVVFGLGVGFGRWGGRALDQDVVAFDFDFVDGQAGPLLETRVHAGVGIEFPVVPVALEGVLVEQRGVRKRRAHVRTRI